MAATPEPGASWVARPRSRLSALRPTARFRAQLARAGVVVLVVVGIFGTLTLAFGISVLQYALGGMVISSIRSDPPRDSGRNSRGRESSFSSWSGSSGR